MLYSFNLEILVGCTLIIFAHVPVGLLIILRLTAYESRRSSQHVFIRCLFAR